MDPKSGLPRQGLQEKVQFAQPTSLACGGRQVRYTRSIRLLRDNKAPNMPAHAHLGYTNPTLPEIADPGVYYDPKSKKWYCFATNGVGKNIQAAYSDDFCCWTKWEHEVLPAPFPPWTGTPGLFWAPEVISAPEGRPGHLMYVSTQDLSTGKQCIGVAYTEGGPLGPYKFISHGPLVSRGETGGCIDPQPFVDHDGSRWLVFKNDFDKMYTKGPQIWIQPLSKDGLGFTGDRTPLQAPHAGYQGDLLEAPYLTHHPQSNTYCLFYSSGTFTTEGYATSYSISRNGILGPYEPSGKPLLYTDKHRGIRGPGGACVVQGVEDHWFIVFHSLVREDGPRSMCIQRLTWHQDGTPHLSARPNEGHRLRLGAEDEDDEACGLKAKAGPTPTFSAKGGGGGGGMGGDKVKAGLQKVLKKFI